MARAYCYLNKPHGFFHKAFTSQGKKNDQRHSPWQFEHQSKTIYDYNYTTTPIYISGMSDNLSTKMRFNMDSSGFIPFCTNINRMIFPSLAASFPSGCPGPLLGLFVEEPRQRSYGGGRKNPVFVGRRKQYI